MLIDVKTEHETPEWVKSSPDTYDALKRLFKQIGGAVSFTLWLESFARTGVISFDNSMLPPELPPDFILPPTHGLNPPSNAVPDIADAFAAILPQLINPVNDSAAGC